jgi:hypothetical protein
VGYIDSTKVSIIVITQSDMLNSLASERQTSQFLASKVKQECGKKFTKGPLYTMGTEQSSQDILTRLL